jgi:hypothetical protein
VRILERVGVPLDLNVDASKLRVATLAHCGNSATKSRHVLKEQPLAFEGQVEQLISAWSVGDEDAVTRQVLNVPDDGEARAKAPEHCRVGAGERAANPIGTEVFFNLGHDSHPTGSTYR